MRTPLHHIDMTSSCSCRAAGVDRSTSTVLLIAVLRQITTAATDARTGLLTHDAWQAAARHALASHTSCALLLIDLDHFKRINDTHGHLIGDQLVAAVAAQIRQAADPHHGVAGRFGGDEFVALLPDVDEASAYRHADGLRERVAAVTIATGEDDRTARTTVSIGLTLTTAHADLTDALWRADAALYAAKAAGRNTVRSAGTAHAPDDRRPRRPGSA